MHRWSTWALDKFNGWFVSDGGVWQTLLACLAVVVLEEIFPHVDPDHFIVLYVLTVYSGVTQPALARAGRVSGDRQEQMLAQIEALQEQVGALVTQLTAKEDEEIALLQERAKNGES
jgi:hypothetical protein